MIKYCYFLVSIFFCYASFAQQHGSSTDKSVRFSSISQVGLLNGSKGQSVSIETAAGVQIKKWFGGIGTGIDYYGTRGIPLFATVQKQFGDKSISPMVFGSGGLFYPWATERQKADRGYAYTSTPGAWYNVGAGIKISLHNNSKLLLSVAYSFKQAREKAELFSIWPAPVPGPPTTRYESYDYRYRCIVLKLGFQF